MSEDSSKPVAAEVMRLGLRGKKPVFVIPAAAHFYL
jgi:hypothetical protein